MRTRTLKKCIRRAKTFARKYRDHPIFNGYTETEITIGSAITLAFIKEHKNHKHAGCLPVPGDKLLQICAGVGADDMGNAEFHRAMEAHDILLDLFKSKDDVKGTANHHPLEDKAPP